MALPSSGSLSLIPAHKLAAENSNPYAAFALRINEDFAASPQNLARETPTL